MSDHESLSIRQLQQVNDDVAELAGDAQEIARLLASAYGTDDPRAMRSQDICDAIQRLRWAMERQSKTVHA
jgi:hypothetical protein